MKTSKKFQKCWNAVKKSEDVGEIDIYGPITSMTYWGDEVTPQQFADDIRAMGDIKTLNIYINSPGGEVYAGQAIHSILTRLNVYIVAHVDGIAASIASVIPMAADKIIIYSGSHMMIHKPYVGMQGNADELRAEADRLDKLESSTIISAYAQKTGMSEEDLAKMLENGGTWLSDEECIRLGFADEVVKSNKVAACLDADVMKNYVNIPECYVKQLKEQGKDSKESNNEPLEESSNYSVKNKLRHLKLLEL